MRDPIIKHAHAVEHPTLPELLKHYTISADIATFEDGTIEFNWRRRYPDNVLSDPRYWSFSHSAQADLELVARVIAAWEQCADELDARRGVGEWNECDVGPIVENRIRGGSHEPAATQPDFAP